MKASGTKVRVSILAIIVVLLAVWYGRDIGNVDSDPELLEAIRTSDVQSIQRYLGRGGSPDRYIDVYGRQLSLLKAAVVDREESIALLLVDAGADLTESGVSIQEVGRQGLNSVLAKFLNQAPPVDSPVQYSGIIDAALNGYYDTVEIYLGHANRSSNNWDFELNQAAAGAMLAGYDDVALLILESGAPLDEMLHVASRFSSPGMVRYLLRRGLDPSEPLELPPNAEPPERTPLEFAWRRYQEEVVRSQDPSAAPFSEFVSNSDAEYVLYELIRAGGILPEADEERIRSVALDGLSGLAPGRTERIVEAARDGFIGEVEGVLDSTTAVDSGVLREALIAALASDHDDIARLLINVGAPVDGGPLHVAAAASSPGIVRRLLAGGADPSQVYFGQTTVQYWLANSSTEDAELNLHELIRAGAEVCFLVPLQDRLPGVSVDILRHSAPACWIE